MSNIKDKGGNKLAIVQLNSTLALVATLTSGTTFLNLGNISESNISKTTSKTEYSAEDGRVKATDFDFTLPTTATLMETDKTKIDFLASTVEGKKYLEYKYQGVKAGKHQEFWKIVDVTPQFSLATPGGVTSFAYESTGIFPDSTITYTSTTIGLFNTALGATLTIRHTGAVAITGSKGFLITEKAVA